jgi:CarboxypepD_reg-like domain/TonB-dependent Receptor Plug Domain
MLAQVKRQRKNLLPAILALAFLLPLSISAQKLLPDVVLSIEARDLPLSEVLLMISKKSGILFSYNPKKIPADQKINYSCASKTLRSVLDDLSKQLGLKYDRVENQIILRPSKKNEIGSVQPTISGYVKDGKNGEALIGASLVIQELQTGAISNAFGFFSLTLPPGKYTLACSFIGYQKFTTVIDLNSSVTQEIILKEQPPILQEIVVHEDLPNIIEDIQSSKLNLRPGAVVERTALFGEEDVVKSLESVPGIKMHSDGSTFYYVRGGNRDQNLLLLDDAPIYNSSHLLGIFSTIIPDAVNDITLYKGNMPASLGGRLSSVLDVRTKKGNDQHFQVWGNFGLISSKIGVEGPIKKSKSSFLVSARISRLQEIVQLKYKDVKKFSFYDITAKTNFRLNASNRLFFSFYTGGDNYFLSNSGIAWTNTASTLRWNHTFNDRLFLNSTMAVSGYDYNLFTDVATNTRWNSHISNFNLKTDFSYFVKPQNEITFGSGINGYNFNPGNQQTGSGTSLLPPLSVRNSIEFVIYGNHEVMLNSHWGLNYGVRLSSWTNTGEAFEFVYDQNHNPIDTLYYKKGQNYKNFVNAEPRITASYLINEKSSFKASLARNVQNVHLISNSTSPFTSLEVWLPSSINIKPQIANQVTFGYYRSLSKTGTTFVAEAFYKKMQNQIDYVPHAETLSNPLLERELRFGAATAYGIEALAKKDEGRLRGLIGYSYSRAKRKFADINQGQTYNAFYDRPHQINVVVAYDISLRWNLGVNWNYATGAPYSSPTSFYSYNGEEVPVYGQKNNDRLPDYHRMDVSATFKLNKKPEKKFHHSLTISVFNAYGRKNSLFVNYNKTQLSYSDFKIPSNTLDANRSTSQFYLFGFTPSVSYNFKWL